MSDLSSLLVDTETLARHRADPGWVIFDCRHDTFDFHRGAKVYAEGHIGGAHFAAMESVLSGHKTGKNGRHPLPVADEFAAFLNRHGVTPQTQLVAYDDAGGQYAARFWWLARWIGLQHVAVLDGGFPKWVVEGRLVTAEVPVPRGGGTV